MSLFTWHILRDKTGKPVMGKLVGGRRFSGRDGCEVDHAGRHHCFVLAESLRMALVALKKRHADTAWVSDERRQRDRERMQRNGKVESHDSEKEHG